MLRKVWDMVIKALICKVASSETQQTHNWAGRFKTDNYDNSSVCFACENFKNKNGVILTPQESGSKLDISQHSFNFT